MRYKESLLLPFLLAINIILPVTAQEKPRLKIGGALRFNYNYSDWKPESRNRGGEFDFDVLRLNVNASYKKIDLAVDYRFYPSSSGGGMLREGWIGYRFNDSHRLQIGLTTVPFGVLPYTGNNYFFNLNYYAGLEDDADMGIKYLFHKDRWELSLAYFQNADLSGTGGDSVLKLLRVFQVILLGRACPKPCRVTIKFIIVPWTEYNTSFDDTLLLFLQKSNYLW